MNVSGIIWLRDIVNKLLWKHRVTPDEVVEVLHQASRYRFIETGDVAGEDVDAAMGQTEVGRYLIVFFVYKTTGEALVISARDMTRKERRSYEKK